MKDGDHTPFNGSTPEFTYRDRGEQQNLGQDSLCQSTNSNGLPMEQGVIAYHMLGYEMGEPQLNITKSSLINEEYQKGKSSSQRNPVSGLLTIWADNEIFFSTISWCIIVTYDTDKQQ